MSLVEVLVSTVLLSVGIGGCLSSLVASAQLRQRASDREAVAAAVDERVRWIGNVGCANADTVLRSAPGAPVSEVWRVTRDSGVVRLEGRAESLSTGLRRTRFSLAVRVRCP